MNMSLDETNEMDSRWAEVSATGAMSHFVGRDGEEKCVINIYSTAKDGRKMQFHLILGILGECCQRCGCYCNTCFRIDIPDVERVCIHDLAEDEPGVCCSDDGTVLY